MAGTAGRVRPPAVAGAFYPAAPERLADLVDRLLARGIEDRPHSAPPRRARPRPATHALVVPHAGYRYSGEVAAIAYASLRASAAPPTRVVIVGPAHFVALRGASVPVADAWSTPLGGVPVDVGLRDAALAAGAIADDRPHAPEHAIEVQLPFLQRLATTGRAPLALAILPIAVGGLAPAAVADLLTPLAAAADLVIVSTDLSHDERDEVARRLDRRTLDAVVALDPDAIDDHAACGATGLRGIVEYARRGRSSVTVLDRRTSADAGGDPGRVVGYAAVAIG
jgi:AmmeMemoRadiSam system protein B